MKKLQNTHFILDSTERPDIKTRIIRMVRYLLAARYRIEMAVMKAPAGAEKRYKVSVCTIFKNEAPYLREWIEFNHITGIDHFYLYNNNSEDDYLPVIQPYIDSGLVTLVQWPKNQAQMECYNDCIEKYKGETQWLGFIDADEFIVPIETNSIYEILKPFENKRGSVKIYWKMFGTSGLLQRDPDTLVTEKFVVAWPKYYSVGKCFYNTKYDFDFTDKKNRILHHLLWTNHRGKRIPPVNAFDKICLEGTDHVRNDCHPVQINHYFTKSYEEYAMKKAKGDVYFRINPHDEEYFYLHEAENTAVDYSAYKYLIRLKKALQQ